MKILIIGIDALEYSLVEKYNLKNLMQTNCCKIKVPINKELNKPTTPSVWASFLAGKTINRRFAYENRFLKLVDFLFKLKKKFISKSFGFGSLTINIFKSFNQPVIKTFPKLKAKTFLEKTNSDYCNIPFYDYSEEYKKIVALLNQTFIENKLTREQLKRKLLEIFENDKERIIKKLKNSKPELFFCYFHFLDLIQHSFFDNPYFIKECYKKANIFVAKLKKLSKANLTVIISDHGQKNGIHTDYGFCSMNKNIKIPEKIEDFHDFFINHLKKHEKKN